MRAKAVVLCLSSVAAVTVACGLFDSGPGLSHAAWTVACGPAGGGFPVILLAEDPIESAQPAFPYVRIVFLEPSALAPRTWDITTNTGPGAWYVTGPGRMQSALSGRVSVASVDSAYKVDGSVELRFTSRLVETAFSAPHMDTGILCN